MAEITFLGDEVILSVEEGIHVVDEEDKQHFTVLFHDQSLKLKQTERVFEDGFLLVLPLVVADEVGFEVVLDEVSAALVLWLEYAELNHLEDYLELEWR